MPALDPKTGLHQLDSEGFKKYTLRSATKLDITTLVGGEEVNFFDKSKAFIVCSAIETDGGSLLVEKIMLNSFDEKQEFIVDDEEQEFTVDDFATSYQGLLQVSGPATLVQNEIKASLGRKPITLLAH